MRARARRGRLSGRVIISIVLAAAFATSMGALVFAMQPQASSGRAPKIDLPQYASASPSSISLADRPSTMVPHVPRLGSDIPGGIINLTNWKLTLPTGGDEAEDVTQPKLNKFRDTRFFHTTPVG